MSFAKFIKDNVYDFGGDEKKAPPMPKVSIPLVPENSEVLAISSYESVNKELTKPGIKTLPEDVFHFMKIMVANTKMLPLIESFIASAPTVPDVTTRIKMCFSILSSGGSISNEDIELSTSSQTWLENEVLSILDSIDEIQAYRGAHGSIESLLTQREEKVAEIQRLNQEIDGIDENIRIQKNTISGNLDSASTKYSNVMAASAEAITKLNEIIKILKGE